MEARAAACRSTRGGETGLQPSTPAGWPTSAGSKGFSPAGCVPPPPPPVVAGAAASRSGIQRAKTVSKAAATVAAAAMAAPRRASEIVEPPPVVAGVGWRGLLNHGWFRWVAMVSAPLVGLGIAVGVWSIVAAHWACSPPTVAVEPTPEWRRLKSRRPSRSRRPLPCPSGSIGVGCPIARRWCLACRCRGWPLNRKARSFCAKPTRSGTLPSTRCCMAGACVKEREAIDLGFDQSGRLARAERGRFGNGAWFRHQRVGPGRRSLRRGYVRVACRRMAGTELAASLCAAGRSDDRHWRSSRCCAAWRSGQKPIWKAGRWIGC